ncbi:MAG: hypothetical protein FWG96_02450 [Methanomassiliicoccaceae archaeon]|nr:hypothetical protein [Methanomassiliicoccaceae archaeon]
MVMKKSESTMSAEKLFLALTKTTLTVTLYGCKRTNGLSLLPRIFLYFHLGLLPLP